MITLADARTMISAAETKTSAWIGRVDIAIDNAWTARAFEISTEELAELSQSGDQFFGIHASNRGRMMIFAGGAFLEGATRSPKRAHRRSERT